MTAEFGASKIYSSGRGHGGTFNVATLSNPLISEMGCDGHPDYGLIVRGELYSADGLS